MTISYCPLCTPCLSLGSWGHVLLPSSTFNSRQFLIHLAAWQPHCPNKLSESPQKNWACIRLEQLQRYESNFGPDVCKQMSHIFRCIGYSDYFSDSVANSSTVYNKPHIFCWKNSNLKTWRIELCLNVNRAADVSIFNKCFAFLGLLVCLFQLYFVFAMFLYRSFGCSYTVL